jgi:hypothetical protein
MAVMIVRDEAAEVVMLLAAASKRAQRLSNRLRNSKRYEYASAVAQLTDGALVVARSLESDVTPAYNEADA